MGETSFHQLIGDTMADPRRSASPRARRKDTHRRAGQFPQPREAGGSELLTTYAVGPGQTYSSIGAVPWTNLGPGDTVAIHWQPTPYQERS